MVTFVSGNKITLLQNGEEYFPALEAEIDRAKQEVYLQTYIYEADNIGNRIAHALMRAAVRGVSVYLLMDGYGSKDLPKEFVEMLKGAGVKPAFFRPKISPWTLRKNRLRRLHRKVCVVDRSVGFVGGINIIDDFNVPHNQPQPPRIDYAVRVEGPLVGDIHHSAYRFWRLVAARRLTIRKMVQPQILAHHPGMLAAYVLRDNVLHRRDIENAYLAAIAVANKEILIANAYFIPGRRFRRALLDAAARGVRVRLLLQGHMEYWLLFATSAFYSQFLQHGIEIYEYHKSFMHSKVAVIDEEWATVGSSNIDPFSLLLAREANVIVKNTEFAVTLKTTIEQSIKTGSLKIRMEDWQQASISRRFFSWLAYGLVRLMQGMISDRNI